MKSIIFDLDDTLYVDKDLRQKREQALLDFIGDKAELFYELKKTKGTLESLDKLGVTKEQAREIFRNVPISLKKDKMLVNLLKKLKKNYNLIVLSNSPKSCAKIILEQLGVFGLIDSYYANDDFVTAKPDKECFFMVKEGDICVGNDFEKDLFVPKQLGAVTVHLTDGEDSEADFKINNIYELEKILVNYINK